MADKKDIRKIVDVRAGEVFLYNNEMFRMTISFSLSNPHVIIMGANGENGWCLFSPWYHREINPHVSVEVVKLLVSFGDGMAEFLEV